MTDGQTLDMNVRRRSFEFVQSVAILSAKQKLKLISGMIQRMEIHPNAFLARHILVWNSVAWTASSETLILCHHSDPIAVIICQVRALTSCSSVYWFRNYSDSYFADWSWTLRYQTRNRSRVALLSNREESKRTIYCIPSNCRHCSVVHKLKETRHIIS